MAGRTYIGQCHCGAIGFQYDIAAAPAAWPVRACQCRFCRSHGAATTSSTEARIHFRARNIDALGRYRFGLETADFLVCRRCGVYIGAYAETAAGNVGIVNTRALQPRPNDLQAPVAVRYDGETAAARLTRRAARWSPADGIPR